MGQLPLTALFSSLFTWTSLYFCIRIFNHKCSLRWNNRIVSFMHNSLAGILVFISAICIGPWPLNYMGQKNLPFHIAIITISAGYLLYDTLWCMWYRTGGPLLLTHHVVSFIFLCSVLHIGWYGCETSAAIGLSEVSTSLWHLQWFLKKSGRYKGHVAKVVDYARVIVYFGARLGLGTILHIHIHATPNLDLIIKLCSYAFYIISIIYGIRIVQSFIN